MRISKIVPATAGLKRHSLAPAHVVSPIKIAALAAVCLLTSAAVTAAVNTPYQSTLYMTGKCPTTPGATCYFDFPPVPSGYRLVVERLSGVAQFTSTPGAVSVQVNNPNGSGSALIDFDAPFVGGESTFDHPTLFYVNAGEQVQVQISGYPAAFYGLPNVEQAISAIGYLIKCDDGSCPPIAH